MKQLATWMTLGTLGLLTTTVCDGACDQLGGGSTISAQSGCPTVVV
jgi:hypothetical protein